MPALPLNKASRAVALFTQTANKTVGSTKTETSIIGTGTGTLAIPPMSEGKGYRVALRGYYSTPIISLVGSLTCKIKLGTATLATVVITELIASATNLGFEAESLLTCRSAGTSGNVAVMGGITYATGAATPPKVAAINNAPSGSTVDTTVAQTLDIAVTWSNANANSVLSYVSVLEALN